MNGLAVAGLAPFAAVALLLASTPLIDRLRRRALRRIVRDAVEVLNAHGIAYWCDFGTLLGLHREGDIILGDKDADLCLLEAEEQRLLALRQPLAARGLDVVAVPNRRGLFRIRDRRTPWYVDIYLYSPDGELLRSLLIPGADDVPEHLVRRLVPTPFLGTTVLAPADREALCLHRYGPRFMVPRRNDKGRTRPFSRLRSLGEEIEHAAIAVWGLSRAALRSAYGTTRTGPERR